MKRRDFLVSSAGMVGATVSTAATAQSRPCPPGSVRVTGGAAVNTSCGSPNAELDWIARSTAAGVVWSHDFRSRSEVDQFRVAGGYGNDPTDEHGSTVKHITSDGITGGGCLEINVPTGGIANGGWWRPMSAIRAGDNGKATADLADGGSLPARAWNATRRSENYDWRGGYYGHIDYHRQFSTWQGRSNLWDGTEFYLQFRVKQSASRWLPRSPQNPYGKLMFIDITGETGDGELVLISGDSNLGYWNKTSPFRMYTSRGSNPNSALSNPQGDPGGASIQPGSAWERSCVIGGNVSQPNMCWEWPADEWVTVLVHLVPGHHNADIYAPLAQWQNRDTRLEVWVARANQTTYTKLFSKADLAWYYASSLHPTGAFNSICPSAYMNNVPAVLGWHHRFDQVIFSRQFIACPQA
jgi:hypothetical protein